MDNPIYLLLLHTHYQTLQLPSSFVHDNTTINNPQAIAEAFNNHFSSIGTSLARNYSDIQFYYKDYMPPPLPFSFFLMPTTLIEVNSIIKHIKDSSSGHHEINITIIKECSNIISPSLVFIMNKSFREGCFPNHLQISRTVSIFKKRDHSVVSILSNFSKIFEKKKWLLG